MNLLVTVALASFVAAPVPKEPPKPPNIDGEWKVVAFIKEGKPAPPEELGGLTVAKGDKLTVSVGKNEETVTFKLDPKTVPASIDLAPEKAGADLTIKGIYKLEKDQLTICFGMDGTDRPKEFGSTADGKTGVLVLERVKK